MGSKPLICCRLRGFAIFSGYNPLYSLAGLMVGALVGMTGVGGGSLMTPLLVMLFGFHPATAVGTDLLYASVTKTVGTAVHNKRKTVDWRIVASLACGSIPTSIATIYVMSRVGTLAQSAAGVLNLILGVTLLLTGISVLLRPWIIRWAGPRVDHASSKSISGWTILLGASLGILVTVTSVGAGALGTTALLMLYATLPVARIAGSDIAHAVPLTLIAGIGHWMIGTVDFTLMAALLVGSIPGIILGSLIATKSSDNVLRPVLGITLIVVAIRMLIS